MAVATPRSRSLRAARARLAAAAGRARLADDGRSQAHRAPLLLDDARFFVAGGVEALLMRTQLAQPDQHLVGPATYDQLLTMHGVTMIFLFVIPMTTGAFGNYLVPLMIGARDMAFPRLNALSYWLFLGAGLFIYASMFVHAAPNAGWFNYVPLALKPVRPGSEHRLLRARADPHRPLVDDRSGESIVTTISSCARPACR